MTISSRMNGIRESFSHAHNFFLFNHMDKMESLIHTASIDVNHELNHQPSRDYDCN